MSDPSEIELAAAGLRADAGELSALLEALAAWLEQSVPQLTKVQRKRAGLLDSRKLVTGLVCQVGPESFALEREGTGLSARRARPVRGVTLKTETLPLATWLDALQTALLREAQVSETSLSALRSLLM